MGLVSTLWMLAKRFWPSAHWRARVDCKTFFDKRASTRSGKGRIPLGMAMAQIGSCEVPPLSDDRAGKVRGMPAGRMTHCNQVTPSETFVKKEGMEIPPPFQGEKLDMGIHSEAPIGDCAFLVASRHPKIWSLLTKPPPRATPARSAGSPSYILCRDGQKRKA